MAATLLGYIINSKLGQQGSFPPMQPGLNIPEPLFSQRVSYTMTRSVGTKVGFS